MLRSFCLLLVLGLAQRVAAQATAAQASLPIDITAAKADPRTRIFDDNKNTVSSYIYAVLEKQTSCCGNDAIYVEVVIRPDGTTESAKALTGRNECLKRTIADILKDIRWDVGTAATKTQRIYFDLKPALACENGKNNTYVEMTLAAQEARRLGITKPKEEPALATAETPAPAPAAVADTPAAAPAPATKPEPKVEPKPATPAPKPAPVKEVESKPAPAVEENTWSEPPPATPAQPAVTPRPAKARPAPQPKPAPVTVAAIPGARYVSAGDRSPDPSHAKSHANTAGPALTTPEYIDGETMKAVYIKQELRKSGVCGLAHVLAELTVDKDGTVKAHRIFQANDPKVKAAIVPVLSSLKYKPESVRFRQTIYLEVKADVECPNGPQSKVNLDQVDNYLQQTRDSR